MNRGSKQLFYRSFRTLVETKSECHRKPLVLGDFNAYCSLLKTNSYFLGHTLPSIPYYSASENGQLLLVFE